MPIFTYWFSDCYITWYFDFHYCGFRCSKYINEAIVGKCFCTSICYIFGDFHEFSVDVGIEVYT
jgi:hypothetical protein